MSNFLVAVCMLVRSDHINNHTKVLYW